MSTQRQRLVGLAAAAGLYVIAAAITAGVGNHSLRPIYEGIGPSSPYRWVHPPSAFKSTNAQPAVISSESIGLANEQTDVFGAGTFDGQLVLSIPAGSIAPSAAQDAIEITITAKDPAKLGTLPVGVYSDGNAYLISAAYQPGQAKITESRKPIDLVIRTPVPSTELLFSSGGRTWTAIPDHHIPGQTAVASTVTSFGYILAASPIPVVAGGTSRGNSTLVLGVLGLAAVLLLSIAVGWRVRDRRRRRRAGA